MASLGMIDAGPDADALRAQTRALVDRVNAAQAKAAEYRQLASRAGALQGELVRDAARCAKELKALRRAARAAGGAPGGGGPAPDAPVGDDLARCGAALRAMRAGVLPGRGGRFLRAFLGRVNVRVWLPGERDAMRDEYHRFKRRMNRVFLLVPTLVLVAHHYLRHQWLDTAWVNVLFQLGLIYFYVSLALRENILRENGSRIKAWWIYHHYLSAVLSLVLVTWPPTPTRQRIVPIFTYFVFFQGSVQCLQLWYQSRRDYVNRSLGRTRRSDISYGETLTEWPRELLVLIPFLFLTHVWQIGLGSTFLATLWTGRVPFADADDSETGAGGGGRGGAHHGRAGAGGFGWSSGGGGGPSSRSRGVRLLQPIWNYKQEVQVLLCGLLCLALGVGNMVTTFRTLLAKKKRIGGAPQTAAKPATRSCKND